MAEQGIPPLANQRNAAAGTLRIKDPIEVSRRRLEAFTYQVSYYTTSGKKSTEPQTHSQSLEMLWELGFRSPDKEKKVLKGIQAVIDYCNDFETKRDELPYEIDGMVIKVNDFGLQERMGMTSHHPRWAMAFKFKARQATSKLLRVEYQVGRTGNIGPVAKLEPVAIGGVTVSSVSLFNEDLIKQKDLRIGDTVLVERAGDVIPYIVKALEEVPNKVKAVVSASAIGWYGPDPQIPNPHPFMEDDPSDNGFLGSTCKEWEESLNPISSTGRRLIKLRTGIVLSNEGGALEEFEKPLKFGVAAILGAGRQRISWIHIDDLVRLYINAIESDDMRGVFNAVAPKPVSNKEFTLHLANAKRGKFFIPVHVPAFVLKIKLGELSIEVLKSATVSCDKIHYSGFTFLYPSIDAAFQNLYEPANTR